MMFVENFMKPKTVAKIFAVDVRTIYRWFWEGKLVGVKIGHVRKGGSIRIKKESVLELISKSEGSIK